MWPGHSSHRITGLAHTSPVSHRPRHRTSIPPSHSSACGRFAGSQDRSCSIPFPLQHWPTLPGLRRHMAAGRRDRQSIGFFVTCRCKRRGIAIGGGANRPAQHSAYHDAPAAMRYPRTALGVPHSEQRPAVEPGMQFERSYTPSAGCCPARAVLLSGAYHWHYGVYNQIHSSPSVHRDMNPDVVLFANRLHDAAYSLGYTGKWHANCVRTGRFRLRGWRG